MSTHQQQKKQHVCTHTCPFILCNCLKDIFILASCLVSMLGNVRAFVVVLVAVVEFLLLLILPRSKLKLKTQPLNKVFFILTFCVVFCVFGLWCPNVNDVFKVFISVWGTSGTAHVHTHPHKHPHTHTPTNKDSNSCYCFVSFSSSLCSTPSRQT